MADNKEQRQVEILLNAQQANASIKDMAAGVALMNNQLTKMSQDDPRREQLKKDFQELKDRVKAARDELNGLTSAEERQRQETERLTLAAEQLQQANVATIAQGQDMSASYRQMKDAAGLLEKQLEEMSADDPGRQRLIDDFQALKTRMTEAKAGFAASSQAAEELRQRELELAQATQRQAAEQAEATKQLVANGQRSSASFNEMKAAATQLEKQLHELSADDPGRAAMITDFQQLQQRMAAARTTLNTYVLTEEQARLAAEKLNQENQQVILNGQKINASFNDLRASASLLEQQLHELSADDPGRKKLLADYHALQERIAGVSKEMQHAGESTSFFKQGLASALGFVAGGGITELAGQVVDLGKDIFETTAKFQTYETVMTNALGDKSKAQQAMKDIQTMAANTPFSVDELTGSFLKFVNRGLKPSMAEMKNMGDLASSQGKSFDQLTEAVLDAAGGEFERLKEFGLKASKSGDQVSLSFKGVNQVVKNTPEAINGAILAFGRMRGVAGGMDAISKTLEGQLSNLGDSADQLKIKMGEGLKPVFTWLLTMFGNFIGWIGRFIEAASPLKELFTGIVSVFQQLYGEVADVLESLGLFSDKTDTVKIAVEVLKLALTVLLIPVKALALAAEGIVDTFIKWYNKSELLRGILGGLGAVVVSLFTTIKDDALKILGGVGDIIVGIFTLDKDKIIAGFKSALSGTADVALAAGDRAAEQFSKGYLANKDNHIVRKVHVKTEVSEDGDGQPAGEKLTSDKSAADAAAEKKRAAAAKKAKAERDRVDRERLADLKRWVKEEGDVLDTRNTVNAQRDQLVLSDEEKRRERQRQKLFEGAKKHLDALTGQELDYSKQVQAIVEERDLSLRELQAKFDEEDKKEREKKLDQQIKDSQAEAELALANLQLQLADKCMSQVDYDEAVYRAKQAALDKELALVKQRYGAESAEYKKLQADKLKEQAAHTTKTKGMDADLLKFKGNLGKAEELLNDKGVKSIEESLDKQSGLYKAFQLVRKAAAIAHIELNLVEEVSSYWKNSAEFGPAGIAWAALQSAVAVVRAGVAMNEVAGYAKGGPTGEGVVLPRPAGASMLGVIGAATGLDIATNGKLVDAQGLEVAGIVHKNEYVIPEWMRADPQVIQVENWLEARRQQRGFHDGGPTTESSCWPTAGSAVGQQEPMPLTTQLVQVLASLDQRLQGVEQWATQLEVVNDLLQLERDQEKLKKVKSKGSIK